MTELGIDEATQDSLVAKIESGELPDSNTGAEPVREWTERHGIVNRTIEEFADGSRSVTDIEAPEVGQSAGGGMVALGGAAISGCTAGSGVGSWWYTNCRVSQKDTISETGFIVDYKTTNISGQVAEVRDPRGTFCTVYAGTCNTKSAKIVRAKQSGTLPARASMSFTGTLVKGAKSVSGEVWIDVHNLNRSVYSTP